MKSIVIHASRDLRLEERNPGIPGQGQVAIKLAIGGICGSDLHYYHNGGFGAVRLREPMILGHEVSGYITDLGMGVEHLDIGELVAISPSRPCKTCTYCKLGLPNHCLNMRFYGSAMPFPHIQGAFREHLIADADQCAPAKGLSAGEAAMAEPLAVALHAMRQAGHINGKCVLVTGCGPIGALCILAARQAGAAEIIATDISGFTLGLAKTIGADRTINTVQNPESLNEFQAGKGHFDVLFECSGVEAALGAALPTLKPQASIIQLGLGGDMNIPINLITAKELSLKGSFRFHEEFFTGVELMQNGLIDVKPLITQTLCLAEYQQAFDLASDRTRSVKTHITFNT